jgi:hypothetical protein
MKVTIPEELKREVPQTTFGKILSATPVVMAVLATMLAGLASSEMTRAQYERSLAAQQQSKAGDQWSFFQAKRLRGAFQQNTADLLQTIVEVRPFDPGALKSLTELPDSEETAKVKNELLDLLRSPSSQQALELLQKGELPQIPPAAPFAPEIKTALDAAENLKPDVELASALGAVAELSLEEALRSARDQVQAFDTATKPVNQVIDQLDRIFDRQPALTTSGLSATNNVAGGSLNRDFTAARLKYAALRYEVEARLNQAIANLYELQVRKSNISAVRHHARSQRFFFGMLGAQLAVIISTFAMAARQRNLLWSLAAIAGLIAVAFAIYVYLKL